MDPPLFNGDYALFDRFFVGSKISRMSKIKQYLAFFREIQERRWVKWALGFWALLAAYDLVLSQFLPEDISKQLPKVWKVAVVAGNLLPWWGWLLIL